MRTNNDVLHLQAQLQGLLGGFYPDLQIRVFDEIDSTNTEAKRMVRYGFCGTALLIANHQTAGRGRMGRSFYSPKQTGAYFSLLTPLNVSLPDSVTVTGAASVAVMQAVLALCGVQTQIKWVNDLYLNGKKVCGILSETISAGDGTYLIVGIGINLKTEVFPDELAQIAGSLGEESPDRGFLIAEVFCRLQYFLQNPKDTGWLEEYRACSCVLGREIVWHQNGQRFCGVATEIDETGALLVKKENGVTERLFSGEISIRTQ